MSWQVDETIHWVCCYFKLMEVEIEVWEFLAHQIFDDVILSFMSFWVMDQLVDGFEAFGKEVLYMPTVGLQVGNVPPCFSFGYFALNKFSWKCVLILIWFSWHLVWLMWKWISLDTKLHKICMREQSYGKITIYCHMEKLLYIAEALLLFFLKLQCC